MSRPKGYTGIKKCCNNCKYCKKDRIGFANTIVYCTFGEGDRLLTTDYKKKNLVETLESCPEFKFK